MTTNHEIRVRAPWHETGSGCWSLSLSGGGFTVRVTQRKPGAVFERIILLGDGEQSWESLGTADRHVADLRAREFLRVLMETHAPVCRTVAASPDEVAAPARAAKVASPAEPVSTGAPTSNGATCPPPLTLARLWTLYRESEAFASLKEKTRGDYATAARILIASLGPDTEVTMLDQDALTGHENRRYAGGIEYTRISRKGSRDAARSVEVVATKPARARAVGLDLQVLRLMLFWAVQKKGPDGRYLLDQFPLRGKIEIPREKNPVRPFADYEQFCALMEATQSEKRKALLAEDPSAVRRHRLLELALLLTEATGRRISSVRKLRRSDLLLDEDRDFACARVRWRYEHDKMGKALEVPIPRELAVVLHVLVGQLGVIGDALVFAQAGNLTRATSARELTQWLADMENIAGLLHVPGGAWHAFRRKWSKERKDLPVKDVMAAGGWEDVNTFLASYNEADVKTMLAVMEAPARRRAEVAAREATAAAGNLDEDAGPARPNLRVL